MSGKTDLLREIPDWVANSTAFQAVFGAIGDALDNFRGNRQDVYEQLFITTSTWALQFWENELALPFDPALTTEQRRQRILARFRSRQTPTPKAVRAMANSFQNGDVETYMDWETYTLYVRFVDIRGVPANIAELQDQILSMVDANLKVVFQFRYLTVSELAAWGGSVSALKAVGLTVRQLMTWIPTTVHRNTRDAVFRLKIRSAFQYRTTSLRFNLATIQTGYRTFAARLRVRSASAFRNISSRFNLVAANQAIYWGAWLDYAGGGITPNAGSYGGGGTITGTDPVSVFESHAGKQVSMVHINNGSWMSNSVYQSFDGTNLDRDLLAGRFVVTEWHNWDLADPTNDYALRLAAVVNGDHDTYITQWATDCKNWGGPLLIRLPHEMNAGWANAWPWSIGTNGSATVTFGGHTWTNTETDYINFVRHIVNIFRSVGCNNAKFFWCPNVRAPGDHPYSACYPGNDSSGRPYVDWLGWDAYPWFGDTVLQAWRTGETTVDTYAEICALDPNLPIMVGEFGYPGRRGSPMSVTSITANGSQLTVTLPSSPGGSGWQANQGLVLTSCNPSTFNGSYAISSVSGTGPYTVIVPSAIASGTSFVSGTATMVDRISRASIIASDLETNIPAMPRIKAIEFFWTAYSDDEWTFDYAGTSDQANNYDMLALKKAIGNSHYLAGNVLGANLKSYSLSPFENLSVSQRYQKVVLSTSGLEGFWMLDDASGSGTVADISGKSRPGTVTGGIGLGTAGSIPIQSSLTSPSFPGSLGNYASFGDIDAWSPTTTGKQTIEFSFYLPSTPTAQESPISKGSFVGGLNWEWFAYFNATTIGFSLNQPDGGTYAANTNPLPSVGQWHHCVIVSDLSLSNPVSMWIDGVIQSTGSAIIGSSLANGTAPMLLGQRANSDQPLLSGTRIAALAVYSTALTQASVLGHYSVWR